MVVAVRSGLPSARSAASHSARRSRVGASSQSPPHAGVHDDDLDAVGKRHGVDGEGGAVDEQGVAGDAGRRGELVHHPAGHAGRHLLGPLARERQLVRAMPSKPSASATATSSAALDDRPAPTGRVVRTVPAKPCVGRSTATTPAT